MKKKLIPFLTILFFTAGCYIYKPYSENTESRTADSGAAQARSLRDSRPNTPITGGSDSQGAPRNKNQRLTEEEIKMKNEKLKEIGGNEDSQKVKEEETRRQKEEEIKRKRELESGDDRGKGKVVLDTMDDGSILPEPVGISPAEGATSGSLKSKIQPNKYYKISVQDRQYKIQADQWEGDTLISHVLRKPKKVLKFHQNQIDEESLEERRFSKPYSDLITVGSYVAAGAAVLLLVL